MPSKIYFSTDQIDDMLNMFSQNISAPIIAKKYNTSRSTILHILHENGVPYRRDRFDDDTEKKICELYQQYKNQEKVAKIIGTTDVSVGRVLRRNGVEIISQSKSCQKYTLDEEYFDVIDSNAKAYILGLLCADGCLSKTGNNILLSLQEDDKHILEEINVELKSNRPIHFKDYKKRNPRYHNQYYLTITNQHMWRSLVNLGVIPNKSFKLEFPNIDPTYYKSFILGYIDGDGCIHKTLNKVGVLGTLNFVTKINDIIYQQLGITGKIYDTPSNNITKNLEIYGKYKAPLFLDWLYDNEQMFLRRKHQIYLDRYVNKSLAA